MKAPRRVVVTGMGAITPVGNSVDEAWRSVLAGKSGIGPIDTMDVSGFTTHFGGLVKDFDRDRYLGPKEARKMDPFMQYGFAAGLDAFADSASRSPRTWRTATVRSWARASAASA